MTDETHTFTMDDEDGTEITVTLEALDNPRDIPSANTVSATFDWDDGEATAEGVFRDDPEPGLYLAATHPTIRGERVRAIPVPHEIREAVEADIEAARAATDTPDHDPDVQAALDEASETGEEVVVRKWTEDCDGSVRECSLDHVRTVATPDGTVETHRTHAH